MELIVASVILSVAAITLYAMRLHSKKPKPPKPFTHEHIWEPWVEHEKRVKYHYHRRRDEDILMYKRNCIDCGLPEYMRYNLTQLGWE